MKVDGRWAKRTERDFNNGYAWSARLALSFQGSNLLNAIARTSMGGYANGRRYTRSWFIADRRYRMSLDFNF